MKGKVIYSHSGLYKIFYQNETFISKPLGIFRKENIKILVGDEVEFTILENIGREKEISITNLYERRNFFERPNVSNIDEILIFTSIKEPKFNDFLLDKLITKFQFYNLKPILIFTKLDLVENKKELEILEFYKKNNYEIFFVDKKGFIEKKDLKRFKKILMGKFCSFVGQTGVGKTTFLNNISNNTLNLKTQEISKSLGRGKHTTRHLEIFTIFENTFFIDTPGFSMLELKMEKIDVSKKFLNFEYLSKNCSFKNCLHIKEENCNVKNNIDERKYNNYLKIISNI